MQAADRGRLTCATAVQLFEPGTAEHALCLALALVRQAILERHSVATVTTLLDFFAVCLVKLLSERQAVTRAAAAAAATPATPDAQGTAPLEDELAKVGLVDSDDATRRHRRAFSAALQSVDLDAQRETLLPSTAVDRGAADAAAKAAHRQHREQLRSKRIYPDFASAVQPSAGPDLLLLPASRLQPSELDAVRKSLRSEDESETTRRRAESVRVVRERSSARARMGLAPVSVAAVSGDAEARRLELLHEAALLLANERGIPADGEEGEEGEASGAVALAVQVRTTSALIGSLGYRAHVRRLWDLLDTDCSHTLSEKELRSLVRELNLDVKRSQLRERMRAATSGRGEELSFEQFVLFVEALYERAELVEIYSSYCSDAAAGMTTPEFLLFLREAQQEPEHTLLSVTALLSELTASQWDANTGRLSAALFSSYLTRPSNGVVALHTRTRVYHDMSLPLSCYFVASSHNTYCTGDQLAARPSAAMFEWALRMGWRCVEIDVWDGAAGEPCVTHGHTMMAKIALRECLETVRKVCRRGACPAASSIQVPHRA